jgi:hypothetical protein
VLAGGQGLAAGRALRRLWDRRSTSCGHRLAQAPVAAHGQACAGGRALPSRAAVAATGLGWHRCCLPSMWRARRRSVCSRPTRPEAAAQVPEAQLLVRHLELAAAGGAQAEAPRPGAQPLQALCVQQLCTASTHRSQLLLCRCLPGGRGWRRLAACSHSRQGSALPPTCPQRGCPPGALGRPRLLQLPQLAQLVRQGRPPGQLHSCSWRALRRERAAAVPGPCCRAAGAGQPQGAHQQAPPVRCAAGGQRQGRQAGGRVGRGQR